MRYILAHDLGTSGDKATLFDTDGRLINSVTYGYAANFFNANWAEQDADDWWRAVCVTTKSLIENAKIDVKDIAVISFSGQMMGCLCVDKNGRPLRRSIIWADQRAEAQAKKLEDGISQWDFYRLVGHRNTASYGIQKLMWIKENEPEIYENTYKALNAKDYILFQLTGNFYTEYSDADSWGCFDINNLCWSERILSCAGISTEKLPECKPSTYIGGRVTAEAASLTGLWEGTPVVLGGGDGVTANVGTGSVKAGKTYCCMGTSAWITTTTEKPIFDEQMRIVNWPHIVPGCYAPNGTMQTAGGSINWMKEQICRIEQYDAKVNGKSPFDYINEEIMKSPAGANGIIFLPYLLGERAPRWDSDAKGAFIGLKAENTRNDLLRSVLEGVAMNLAVCLDVLKTRVRIDEIMVIGGGARGGVLRQIMADIFDTKIIVPSVLEEAGSMGAAITGGVGVGLYQDFEVADRFIQINAIHEPNKENSERYRELRELFDELYYALKPLYKKMH